ncbi:MULTISPECIES: transposase [unclassified Acinetobacter]|uniref:Transposase n=1 Tax=Acinetobacter lwoffii TaxID=28090 RepID=A0A9D2UUX1_ACILW|nr:hypothetical protein E5Y90_13715 [Acinetobacter sp. 10FS3-1]TQR60983.1 hypothetical protein E2K52_12185 [Acinetobacter sp. RF14B]HJF28987.1 transposase [Acinetobacter lwoffii]
MSYFFHPVKADTGIRFINSTELVICPYFQMKRHRGLKNLASREKSTEGGLY